MPMRNYSTLLYFVTDFNNDLETIQVPKTEVALEDQHTVEAFEPSERSVKNILNFARSYDVLETESTGYVEMNLN